MEVNGQFHVPLALSSVHIEKEPRWASVSGRFVKENSFSHYIFDEHYTYSALCFTFSSQSLHRSPLYVACHD